MLEYNQIKPKSYIVFKDEPFEVIEVKVSRKQQRKPVNTVKMRNLLTGKVIENSFHHNEKVTEANIETKPALYLYVKPPEVWFCDPDNPKDRFSLGEDLAGEKVKFLPTKTKTDILYFDDQPIDVRPPIKIEVQVKEAPPDVRGSTVQAGTKPVTLESGAVINVPMFIKEGDVIRVNTETGQYVERV